jgi:hypothetical protein
LAKLICKHNRSNNFKAIIVGIHITIKQIKKKQKYLIQLQGIKFPQKELRWFTSVVLLNLGLVEGDSNEGTPMPGDTTTCVASELPSPKGIRWT